MKVLLVSPPFTSYLRERSGMTLDEPLGIAYIASVLLQNGFDVRILDSLASAPNSVEKDGDFFRYGLSLKSIQDIVKEYSPDLVGITSMFTIHAKGMHDSAKAIKEIKDVPIIVGGAHPSSLPHWVLKDKNIDLVVQGEGEFTFLDIAKHIEKGRSIKDIDGTVVMEDGKLKFNKPREFSDINSIPFPARQLLPMKTYLSDFSRFKTAMRPPRANMVTSRGCPFNCVFCSIHSIWGHNWRGRNPESVVDEIEFLAKEYKVGEFAFQDDNVSLNRDRMEKICDDIIERKLKIKWCTPNGIAIWTLDKPLLDKMKKSGCYKLTFGIETGCLETQRFIRKTQINLEKAKEIIKYCNKIGLWTHSAFILGFPYETKQNIEETINFAIGTDLDMATFWISTPYPATDLYKIYEQEKLLPENRELEWLPAVDKPACNTKHLTIKELESYKVEAHKRFYDDRKRKFLNPLRIIRKIHSFEDLKYAFHLVKMANKMIGELTQTY
jgi:magnesium-protoporphyrin IX monomethyl ester (oxidative) cyclase